MIKETQVIERELKLLQNNLHIDQKNKQATTEI